MMSPLDPNLQPQFAAVLIPVYQQGADIRLVLVERAAGGVHGGHVALPGGKPEPGDASLLDTALREAEEEIGLRRADVAVLAALDPVDARTTRFRVHPFLARVPSDARYRPRDGEIAQVITADLHTLLDPARRQRRDLGFPTWPQARMSDCIVLEGDLLLWGLTLRVLDAVLPRLAAGEWARAMAGESGAAR